MHEPFYDLYYEMPYAAALSTKCLENYCSNCFRPAKQRCKSCFSVVYCGRECQKEDWPWHKCECAGFVQRRAEPAPQRTEEQKYKDEMDEEFIRLLGRVLVRKRKDKGVADLSKNFPEFVQNRSYANLMSHEEKFDRKVVSELLDLFHRFFRGQYLDNISDFDLRRNLGQIMVNDFSISETPDAGGRFSSLGVGLYLNTSRFNHTCEREPRLMADFDGCRIRVRFVFQSTEQETDINQLLPKTEEEFNQLTLSYGFPKYYYTAVPLVQQRRESLSKEYFFECHCPRCDDKYDAILAWDASSRICPTCNTPCILNGISSPGKLVLLCDCPLDDEHKKLLCYWKDDESSREEIKKLESLYQDVLAECTSTTSPLYAYQIGEQIRLLAMKYWHPTHNLRYVQLNENLFTAYRTLALSYYFDHWLFNDYTPMTNFRFNILELTDELPISDLASLRLALRVGEIVLEAYEHQLPDYDHRVITHCVQLGELFELATATPAGCEVFRLQAIEYYKRALEKWLRRGLNNAEGFAEQLKFRIDRAGGGLFNDDHPLLVEEEAASPLEMGDGDAQKIADSVVIKNIVKKLDSIEEEEDGAEDEESASSNAVNELDVAGKCVINDETSVAEEENDKEEKKKKKAKKSKIKKFPAPGIDAGSNGKTTVTKDNGDIKPPPSPKKEKMD